MHSRQAKGKLLLGKLCLEERKLRFQALEICNQGPLTPQAERKLSNLHKRLDQIERRISQVLRMAGKQVPIIVAAMERYILDIEPRNNTMMGSPGGSPGLSPEQENRGRGAESLSEGRGDGIVGESRESIVSHPGCNVPETGSTEYELNPESSAKSHEENVPWLGDCYPIEPEPPPPDLPCVR